MRMEKLFEKPVPLWLVDIPSGDHFRSPGKMDWTQCGSSLRWSNFRSVEAEKLPTVLRNGIDVEPTNGVIYVGPFDKTWEYGGFPKLTLALDFNKLSRTFREVPASLSANELEILQQRFPTMIKSLDGTKLYLSRLSEDDRRLNTDYEWAYARWIEGDPFEALRALFIFVRPEDKPRLASIIASQNT
jgi:hypothetical protein